MNVIFFTSGEGYGHIARDLAVAEELGRRGHKMVICTYGDAAKKARAETKFIVVDVPRQTVAVEGGGRLDLIRTIAYSIMPVLSLPFIAANAFLLMKKYRPDAVVLDTTLNAYDAALPAAILYGKPIFAITNNVNVVAPSSSAANRLIALVWKTGTAVYERLATVMICDFAPPDTVAAYNVESLGRRILCVGPMSRESPEKLPPVNKIKKKLGLGRFILVTRGKYGSESEITKILEDLSRLTKKHTVVVMGDEDRTLGNLHIKKFDYREYLEYLKACDLVITHGGHSTMTECCIFGKPMVLIVTENYWERMGNARGAEELGIAEFIPFSKLTATILHAAVDRMLKKKSRVLKFKELAKKENGAEKAADIMESAVAMEGLKRKQAQ